jgi:hypothetical protein
METPMTLPDAPFVCQNIDVEAAVRTGTSVGCVAACGIGQGMSVPRTNTRQFCHRCNAVDRIGFLAPKELWRLVAGPRWEHDILCLACFAEIGDEKGIEWDVAELEFYPVSYVTLDRNRISNKEQQ